MPYWFDEPARRQQITARRTLHATLGISVLVHLAALVGVVERTRLLSPDDGPQPVSDRLQVRLAVPAATVLPPAPPPKIVQVPRPQATQRGAVAPAHRRPPVLASRAESPLVATPPAPTPPQPAPSQASRRLEGDLWSYIQARRRERGEPAESAAAAEAREPNADLAANLPRPDTGAANKSMNHGGGLFEIKRMTYDDAAFLFFGWNKDMGRETPQLITVRIGDNANMRIAVVRGMIAIIRKYAQDDFLWRSSRHDYNIVLSARPSDNVALESFLLREFFDDNGEPH
jgi:hypothetical protein